MLYVVLLGDNPAHVEARERLMPVHLEFLAQNESHIRAAGPLRDAEDGCGAGGLWVVEADNAQVVAALVEADPFWPTGLRKSVRILEWRQVFAQDGGRPQAEPAS
jgi:uncharacterized protein YciI